MKHGYCLLYFTTLHHLLRGNALNIIALGNWYNKDGDYSKALEFASSIEEYAAIFGLDFVCTVGSNFSPKGVLAVDDQIWSTGWRNLYANNLNIPWYPVLGEDDYRGGSIGAKAQIARYVLNLDMGLWNMQNFEYRINVAISPSSNVSVVFLDTNPLVESSGGKSSYLQHSRST